MGKQAGRMSNVPTHASTKSSLNGSIGVKASRKTQSINLDSSKRDADRVAPARQSSRQRAQGSMGDSNNYMKIFK